MAEPTTQPPPSRPSTTSDAASESFIISSDSMNMGTDAVAPPRPDTPIHEKQSLLEALEQAHASLARSQAENEDLKEQLAASQRQAQDQADQIAMLRGKVEEARRGVMRLQTENRRASQLVAAANSQELRSAKRASFILPPTPASPGGLSAGKHIHRRISSMSDPGLNDLRVTSSPPSFMTSFPDNISGRVTPPGPSAELTKLRAELTACQQALQEATDAREASETAVRALREFIAENAVGESRSVSGGEGLQGLRLPPLPTDADVADEEASVPRKSEEPKRGWGGWLKRDPSNNAGPKAAPPPAPALSIKSVDDDEPAPATNPAASTPLTNFVSSWTRSRSSSSSADATSPAASEHSAAPAPAFRKFTFFGMGATAAASAAPAAPRSSTPPSHLQTQYESEPEESKHVPAPLQLQREGSVRDSVSSATVSDAPEPLSPPADLVDISLGRGRIGEKEEFAGERTPTVGSTTGFAI